MTANIVFIEYLDDLMERYQPHHLSLREETFFLGPQKHSASDAEVFGLLEEGGR